MRYTLLIAHQEKSNPQGQHTRTITTHKAGQQPGGVAPSRLDDGEAPHTCPCACCMNSHTKLNRTFQSCFIGHEHPTTGPPALSTQQYPPQTPSSKAAGGVAVYCRCQEGAGSKPHNETAEMRSRGVHLRPQSCPMHWCTYDCQRGLRNSYQVAGRAKLFSHVGWLLWAGCWQCMADRSPQQPANRQVPLCSTSHAIPVTAAMLLALVPLALACQ